MRSRTLLMTVVLAALLLSACDTEEPAAAGEAAGNGNVAATVDIIDNGFDPSDVEVAAGETVQWTHVGDIAHTVTFEDGPDSGSLGSGDDFEHTFDDAGTFDYVCSIHPTSMTGTVTVTG